MFLRVTMMWNECVNIIWVENKIINQKIKCSNMKINSIRDSVETIFEQKSRIAVCQVKIELH